MRTMTKCFWTVSMGLCFILAMAGTNIAAEYPTKEITVLQGFKPGGGSDILAQLSQPFLEKSLGKGFVNQYLPGATGAIAWTKLAKSSKPDGYTLAITNGPMLQTNYITNKEIQYNIQDLTPIASVISDPAIVVVSKNSPYKTIQDLIEAAKKAPGKLTAGNAGTGGDDFFMTIQFAKAAGIEFQMVPFQGDGPSWQAAMGDKIDASFNNLGTVYPQVKAGNLRALVLFADKRYENLPDVPTAKELGFNVVGGSSRGYSAPANIPAEVKAKLIKAFEELAKNEEFLKACADRASLVDMKIGDDYAKFLADDEKIFKEIWEEVKDTVRK